MMQGKPKFMSGLWQRKLQRERPGLFWLLCIVIAFPFLFVLRLGMNGELGSAIQAGLRVVGACLAVGLIWLLLGERMRRKKREALIDSYLEKRYDQTHEDGPPRA